MTKKAPGNGAVKALRATAAIDKWKAVTIAGSTLQPETMNCFQDDHCQSCGRQTCKHLLVEREGRQVCWKCYGEGWQDHERDDCSCVVAMKIMIKAVKLEHS